MGANGDPNVLTPNLDNMAICGTNFPGAVSGYPLCCPFRGTMITGKYAHNHVDIAPTTLGLCGIDVPDWMEGFDYSHRRTGVDARERIEQEPDSAYLQLIGDREAGYAWRSVVTRDGWKYACVKNGEWLLFDLSKDPYEQNNLSFHTSFKKKRTEMKALLQEWMEKTGDEFSLPQD